MTESWLITGGCGFVGLNLVAALRSGGKCNIRIVDDLSVGSRAGLSMVAVVGLSGIVCPSASTLTSEIQPGCGI